MKTRKLRDLKENKYFKFFSNRYILVLLIFSIWMLFFDANSFLNHRKLNKEIKGLKQNKAYYQTEITKETQEKIDLSDPRKMEKFAREEYWMKKKDEEIILIEIEE
ncbi:septum formation initiator family protein [Spongiivirga sp. MCCC 1A20706]|uniref:FtsB family cell division protein n=1 Tax=Spongiivirga sp. MCCC 1A20706 TaxID=3160963 RepID=UPI0039773B6F